MSRIFSRCFLAGCVAGATIACGRSPDPVARRSPPTIVADYDMEIREQHPRSDGIRHVDTAATIAMLRRAHVSTYFYLVFHASTDWVDLIDEFLPAAAQADVEVWVYLVPPSECCSEPYGKDFVRWAEEAARLSLKHPHLKGFAMDDFASNLETFTPEYTRAMRDAARRINPELRFLPVLYHDDYPREFLEIYAPYFDGTIFPYTADFETVGDLNGELARITERLDPFGLDPLLMIYATKMSVAPYPPSAEYVGGGLRVGIEWIRRGEILGVTTYGMPKELRAEACGNTHHLSLTMPSETSTNAGDFVSASQVVQLDADAAGYRLQFAEQDSYPVGTAGYHFKQLLVDGHLIWDQDVAADADLSWVVRTFDLTPYVRGKPSATLAFRLYDKKGVTNFGIRMSIASLAATGIDVRNPRFTEKAAWTFAARGPGSARYASQPCDPHRQRHVFEAVRDIYGSLPRSAR